MTFYWDANDELDLSCYEIREGQSWASGSVIATDLIANKFSTALGNTRTGTFWIKAKDTSGNWSVTPAKATLQIYGALDPDVLSVTRKRELALEWDSILSEQAELIKATTNIGVSHEDCDAAIIAVPAFFSTRITPYPWTDFTGPTVLGEGGNATLTLLLKTIREELTKLAAAVAVGQMTADIANGVTEAMLISDFVDRTTGQIVWDKIAVAYHTIFAHQMFIANFDNLIPNPNSEIEPPEGGWPPEAFEGLGVVEGNAFDGSEHCRYVEPDTTLIVTQAMPCSIDDQYAFRAQVNGAGASIGIYFNGDPNPASSSTPSDSSGYYSLHECTAKAPAGTTSIAFGLKAGSQGAYFDNLYARRMADALLLVDGMIKAQHLETVLALTGEIRSPNYTAGTASAAPKGFKISGQAFNVAYMDGSTGNAQAEFGGDVNIGGMKAATIEKLYKGGAQEVTSTSGLQKITIPAGIRRVTIQLIGGGGGGAAGQVHYYDQGLMQNVDGDDGGGGGAGGAVEFEVDLTDFFTAGEINAEKYIYAKIGAGGAAGTTSNAGPGVGGDTSIYKANSETDNNLIGRANGGGGGVGSMGGSGGGVVVKKGGATMTAAQNNPEPVAANQGGATAPKPNTFFSITNNAQVMQGQPGHPGIVGRFSYDNHPIGFGIEPSKGGVADKGSAKGKGGDGGSGGKAPIIGPGGGIIPGDVLSSQPTSGNAGQPGFCRVSW